MEDRIKTLWVFVTFPTILLSQFQWTNNVSVFINDKNGNFLLCSWHNSYWWDIYKKKKKIVGKSGCMLHAFGWLSAYTEEARKATGKYACNFQTTWKQITTSISFILRCLTFYKSENKTTNITKNMY